MFGPAHVVANVALPEPSLPVFSTCEARFRKARNTNTLIFSIPSRSSLLLPLLRPVRHAYGQQDARCLHLLQTVALVPSCRSKKLLATVTQALKMPLSPQTKSQLEEKLRPLITKLQEQTCEDQKSGARPLVALQLKEAVAEFLRYWISDPIEGFVLRKEHVINGMRLDDLIVTPFGAGYLRGYRREDGFCTVVYPWGHGFVHVKKVEKVQQVLEKYRKKRTFNEYVALEHQQLYEQIERLLENLPSSTPESKESAKKAACVAAKEEKVVNVEEYKELLKSLEEEHVDTTVLREDLGFLRRVQALVNKVKELRRSHMPPEPEQKVLRRDEDHTMSLEADQQESDELMQKSGQTEEQRQQEKQTQENKHEQELAEKVEGAPSSEQIKSEEEKKQ